MADLIDREWVLKRMVLAPDADVVRMAPNVDAEPVRHGEWVDGMPYTNSHWRVCSECHRSADHPAGGHEYCSHCGAMMDGGTNNASDRL